MPLLLLDVLNVYTVYTVCLIILVYIRATPEQRAEHKHSDVIGERVLSNSKFGKELYIGTTPKCKICLSRVRWTIVWVR